MLQMVPLAESDDDDDGKPSSATQFFAIPGAKKKKPAAPPKPAGPPPGAPRAAGPPGAPPGAPPPGGPPPAAAGIAAPGMGSMPPGPAPIGIQGPVAGGAIAGPTAAATPAAAGATPFGAAAPDAGMGDQQRASSFRVYAIVLGLFGMAFLAMVIGVAAIIFVPGLLNQSGDANADAGSSTTPSQQAPTVAPKRGGEDTAVEEDIPDLPPAPVRRTPRRPSSGSSTSGGSSAPAPAPAPRAPSGPAPVTVNLAAGTPSSSIEIKCPSGFRNRASFAGGAATVANVPQEDCTIYFKGGPPAKFKPVKGGQTLSCRFQGTQAICQ